MFKFDNILRKTGTDDDSLGVTLEENTSDTTAADRLSLLSKQWEVIVGVQKHFNDLEWRIRGLALTALTAIIGFSLSDGVSARAYSFCGLKIGATAAVGALGILLWAAFNITDSKWYHPMLGGAGIAANKIEVELAMELGLPVEDLLSHRIYAESKKSVLLPHQEEWHSKSKLRLFYSLGYGVLLILIAGSILSWNVGSTSITKSSATQGSHSASSQTSSATNAPLPKSSKAP